MNRPAPPEVTRPEGYSVRAATREDFDRVLALIRAADTADWGEPDFTEEGLRYEWGIRDLDLSTDTWLIERDRGDGPDRGACGYGWLLGRMEHRQLQGWIVVHPEHRGRGIEAWLLDLAERRADEHATLAPAGATVLLHQGAVEPDRAGKALLASRGYEHVRISWQMRTSLEPPLPTPLTPDGVEVRTFDPERDARAVHAVIESAFADHWGWVPRAVRRMGRTQPRPAVLRPGPLVRGRRERPGGGRLRRRDR